MLKLLFVVSVLFSSSNLFASNVVYWLEEACVYYGKDDHYHLWDGYHDYRIEYMSHDINNCECLSTLR